MQKVEGSSPFSPFLEKPALRAFVFVEPVSPVSQKRCELPWFA